MSHLDKLPLKWTNFNIIDWVWVQDVIYYERKMRQWESPIYVLHEWSPAQNFLEQKRATVGLYLSLSQTDRDEASLHKVAGRTETSAQRYNTCQQSHRVPGTPSFSHRLSASFVLPPSICSFIHVSSLSYHFVRLSILSLSIFSS